MKKKVLCKLFGHHLKNLSPNETLVKEYECSCCQQKFTVDGYGRIVKLSKYWQENNMHFKKSFHNKISA